MMCPAVLFDLDETLFARRVSLRAFVVDQFSGRDTGRFADAGALADRFVTLDQRGRVRKMLVYSQILEEVGGRGWDATALFDDYEANAWRFARGFPGMAELLTWLRQQGYRSAVVTNGETHIQLRSLLALGLDRMVDTYLISEREGCQKPEIEIFLRAAARVKTLPKNCIFVGDSPESDIVGARAVGMRTIWFDNGTDWPGDTDWRPDATIRSLGEVRKWIEAWQGQADEQMATETGDPRQGARSALAGQAPSGRRG